MKIVEFLNILVPVENSFICLSAGGRKISANKVSKVEINVERKIFNLEIVISVFDFDNLKLSDTKSIELSPQEYSQKCYYNNKGTMFNATITKSNYLSSKGVFIIGMAIDVKSYNMTLPDANTLKSEYDFSDKNKKFIDLD